MTLFGAAAGNINVAFIQFKPVEFNLGCLTRPASRCTDEF
jgi:hypothetical protein